MAQARMLLNKPTRYSARLKDIDFRQWTGGAQPWQVQSASTRLRHSFRS